MDINEDKAENTPAGGVLVGKKDGQTIIHDKGTMSGYLVGKLHKDGGIKAVNKATGQPLEMQGGEVIITAPAVSDQTKREFEGKMMTNREILSAINEKGGGVSFANGGDIPAKIHTNDCEYKLGGKVVKDTDIAHSLGMNSTLKKGKQHFSSGDTTYDVDAIYNAIKKGKLRLKTKEVETFPMKYPVYDKKYSETVKTDFRKPNGITVRTESGEEVLIDGNHRINNAYLKGRKTMKTYYIEDPKQIAKFTKKNKFELGGENKKGGHLSSGKSLKQIAEMHNVSLAHINEELAKGLEVEKEHFADFKERTRVAKDHLVENPNYYTILEKAGLKNGGHILSHHRHIDNLVKDAKSGNTPARDLNNYNDVMDLEADGMVGMESGLAFANGGSLDDYNFNFTVGKWGGFDIGDGEYFMEDFKSLVESKPQFFVKTEEFKDYFETTYIANPFDVEDLEGATDKEYIEMFEFSDTYLTSKLDIVNQLKNNNQIGIYNIVPSKKTGKIEIGDMAWYDLGLNGLGSVISHTPTKESPKYKELIELYKQNFDYAKGGITPIDANIEGDSVDIVESDFAKGGVVYDTTKPKLEKVTIKESKYGRQSIVGRNASNVKELQDIIIDYVRNSTDEVDWIKFYVNDASRGSYYIDLNKGKKNTVKNVNTETVNAQNIKRVIDAKDYLVKNYDWTDFFELGSQAPASTDNYVKKIQVTYDSKLKGRSNGTSSQINTLELYAFLRGLSNGDYENIKIQPIGKNNYGYGFSPLNISTQNWVNILFSFPEEMSLKEINRILYGLYPQLNFDDFVKNNNSNISTPTSTSTGSKELDLSDTKVWLGDDSKLNEEIQKSAFSLGWQWTDGKIVQYTNADAIYFDNAKRMGYNFGGRNAFDNNPNKELNPREILLATKPTITNNSPKTTLTKEELYNSRIWIGDDVNLKKKVIQKLEEIGIPFDNINGNPNADKNIDINIFGYDFVVYEESKEEFDKDTMRKEIFPSDLGIDVTTMGVAPTTTNTSTSAKPFDSFDFSMTKINVSNNPDLSLRVQKKAFEDGWEWENGGGKTIDYNTFNYLYFTKTSISYGNSNSSFSNSPKREITESEIFGSQTPTASIKKPKVERLYIENGASFSDIEKIRLYLDSTTIGNDEIYFYINPNGGGDYIRVEMKDSLSSMYYNRNAGLEPKYKKLREIFELNRAFENYDWEEFFSNVVSSSTTNSSNSASSQDDLVESVVINYQKPNGYIATNAEKLLDEIKRLWKEGGRSKMEITLQPQNVNGLINSPIYITLDTTTNAFTIEPSGVSLSELKDLLKRYYPLNWDKFFEVSAINISYNLAPFEASRVTLNWENLQGMAQTANFYTKDGSVGSGKGFISFLKDIEKNSNGKDVEVTIKAYAQDNDGKEIERFTEFNIGENWFQPSKRTNEEIKSIVENDWIDGITFDKFFEDVIPLSASQNTNLPTLSKEDLKDTKIWIGDDVELKDKVIDKLNQLGIPIDTSVGNKDYKKNVYIQIYISDFVVWEGYKTEYFDKNRFKEIFPSDLGIGLPASKAPATQNQPFDFSDTKIWIGDNPELSRRVQEKAFESGYKWAGLDPFVQNTERKDLYFNSGKSINYGGNDKNDFDKATYFREITEQDIFGSKLNAQTPTLSGASGSVQEITDFKEAVGVLEGIASQASQKYNTNKYDENLGLLKEVKEEYELALSFTPESSFMYERIELMKKITEIQKEITIITELKNGGAFYILSKVIERLDKGEDWKQLGNGEIMVNEVPPQEIDAVIYTEKFKNWFGDWEKALVTKEYDYVSKVLTESGKPCVMYHGAKRIKYSYRQVSNGVLYLAENRSYAEWFSANESPFQKDGDYLTQCFVNIKNPIDLTPFGVEEVDLRDIIQYIDTLYPLAKIYDVLNPLIAKEIIDNNLIGANVRAWNIIRQYPELNTHIRENTNYDGFIYYENNPSDKIFNDQTVQLEDRVTKATAVFKSSQVKLVDAMLFDGSLDDWRFEKGGKVN